jgi:hypothetical protein
MSVVLGISMFGMVGVVYGPLLVGLVFTMMDIYKLFYQGSYSQAESTPNLTASDMTPLLRAKSGAVRPTDPIVNANIFKTPRTVKKAQSTTLPSM